MLLRPLRCSSGADSFVLADGAVFCCDGNASAGDPHVTISISKASHNLVSFTAALFLIYLFHIEILAFHYHNVSPQAEFQSLNICQGTASDFVLHPTSCFHHGPLLKFQRAVYLSFNN
jgi:hypothetical protein